MCDFLPDFTDIGNFSNENILALSEELDLTKYIFEGQSQSNDGPFKLEANPTTLNAGNIPAITDWAGDYGFSLNFDEFIAQKNSKSSAKVYSKVKNKLFIIMGHECPFYFYTNTKPPPGTIIRAMAVFEEPTVDVVRRCHNHSNFTDPSNDGHPAPDHLIRCVNAGSLYETDSNGHHSVLAPFEVPFSGNEFSIYIYKFMCWGSCPGGINRRQIKVVFTLENEMMCLGRCAVSIRICACPFRDKASEEKGLLDDKCASTSFTKKPIKKSKEDEVFWLEVHGKKNYEYLKQVRDMLDLSDNAPQEMLTQVREKYKKVHKI